MSRLLGLVALLAAISGCASSVGPGTFGDAGRRDGGRTDGGGREDGGGGDPCALVDCPTGRSCVDGACVLSGSCDGVVCESATELCVPGRGCVPGEADHDMDGFRVRDGDCDDENRDVHPMAFDGCNAIDDDCDGTVDEDEDPSVGSACSTGLPGPCGSGRLACSRGALRCMQTVEASPETCDGTDEDCDGRVDDGVGGGMCTATSAMGECRHGSMVCGRGGLSCLQSMPATEACDCHDADCNGSVDDSCRLTVYGVYNPTTHDYMPSTAPDEGITGGYVALGPVYDVYTNRSAALGLVQVCRFWNATAMKHLASTSADPGGCVASGDCTMEGCGWIAPMPTCDSEPIQEWSHPSGGHYYTLGTADPARPPQADLTYVGIMGYAWRSP